MRVLLLCFIAICGLASSKPAVGIPNCESKLQQYGDRSRIVVESEESYVYGPLWVLALAKPGEKILAFGQGTEPFFFPYHHAVLIATPDAGNTGKRCQVLAIDAARNGSEIRLIVGLSPSGNLSDTATTHPIEIVMDQPKSAAVICSSDELAREQNLWLLARQQISSNEDARLTFLVGPEHSIIHDISLATTGNAINVAVRRSVPLVTYPEPPTPSCLTFPIGRFAPGNYTVNTTVFTRNGTKAYDEGVVTTSTLSVAGAATAVEVDTLSHRSYWLLMAGVALMASLCLLTYQRRRSNT
jgi:hypothetical protein